VFQFAAPPRWCACCDDTRFVLIGQRGSHQKWRHANGRQVIVAQHGRKPIPIGTLKSIIEGSGLAVDEFR
jgi:predicted RNA binding protein YcfA (HicA-like mRNA interferase family)